MVNKIVHDVQVVVNYEQNVNFTKLHELGEQRISVKQNYVKVEDVIEQIFVKRIDLDERTLDVKRVAIVQVIDEQR